MHTMKTNRLFTPFVLIVAFLLTGCVFGPKVGELQSESQSVELADAAPADGESVDVEVNMGAGSLDVSGGAEELLEADFTYNVAELKPEVEFSEGTLVVRQPDTDAPNWLGIGDFRNEWDLRLNNDAPMNLSVSLGGGSGDLQLSGLSLSSLGVNIGAGEYTIDLTGDWTNDLRVAIDSGAANIRLRLPEDIGARVTIDAGPTTIDADGLTKDGNVYTNDAYGESDVTLDIEMDAGVGQISLEVDD
jgi:hypothetical protein